MKIAILVLAVAAAAPLHAQAAPRLATTLPAAELKTLDAVRKSVWVNWFNGDTAGLRRVLGPELIAISPDAPEWQSLQQTITGSAGFKASGGKFISVKFDKTTVHRFGDVVVMFSHYDLAFTSDGKRQTQKGRATEVFVKHQGKWVHTSWHLDITP